jgi:hypothetical protein
MNMADLEAPGSLGRRDLLVGGAAALAAGGVLAATSGVAGAAAPGPATAPAGDGVAPAGPALGASPLSSPVTTTIASAPVNGCAYRTVNMYEFHPFLASGQVTWSPSGGVYTAGTATVLRATIDVPPGALVHSVEYYIYNNSGQIWGADAYLWVPGQAYLSSIGASVDIPSTGSLAAYSSAATYAGPYPQGAMLLMSCSTPTTGQVLVNGARVGFTQGGGQVGLLDAPVRAYDSRGGDGPLTSNVARTITLPASAVPSGANAVLANITVVDGAGVGYLKAWSASASEPAASAINFGAGAPIANALTLGVSSARKITVKANVAVDVIIDITGYVT